MKIFGQLKDHAEINVGQVMPRDDTVSVFRVFIPAGCSKCVIYYVEFSAPKADGTSIF